MKPEPAGPDSRHGSRSRRRPGSRRGPSSGPAPSSAGSTSRPAGDRAREGVDHRGVLVGRTRTPGSRSTSAAGVGVGARADRPQPGDRRAARGRQVGVGDLDRRPSSRPARRRSGTAARSCNRSRPGRRRGIGGSRPGSGRRPSVPNRARPWIDSGSARAKNRAVLTP